LESAGVTDNRTSKDATLKFKTDLAGGHVQSLAVSKVSIVHVTEHIENILVEYMIIIGVLKVPLPP